MNKMKKLLTYLCLCLIALPALAETQKPATTRIDRNLSIFNDVLRQLDLSYTDTLNYDRLTQAAIDEMLRLVDRYTVYVPKEKDEDLRRMTTGKYGGIGAIIMQRGDSVYISDPYEGLPAQRNDVRPGDRIVSVDGVDCKGKSTSDVSNLLRGKPGTIVKLRLEREGEKKLLVREFAREEIKMPTVDYSAMLTPTTGYISFTEFTEYSSREFTKTLDSLATKGCQELIIDLRGNGGGLISEAISILSLFLPKGTMVVYTKGKTTDNSRTYKTTVEPKYPDMPLIVLVDDNSASASEITCGALQDLKRATLIGEKTFGKGLVQNICPIVYDGHLKVTTARYYLPSDRCIQGTGIMPDIKVNDSTKVNITYSLYTKHLFFDFANRYARTHASYPRPSEAIILGDTVYGAAYDSLFADFRQFLAEKHFTYETETSKYFADVLRFAEQEDLDPATMADLKAMQERLVTNYDDALTKHRNDVLQLLEAEIVTRYYYQVGRTCIRLRQDSCVLRALEEMPKLAK